MSYRHPRFYREDYTGFSKGMTSAFETAFTNVTDYFDKKIEDRKAYEADLHAQGEKMREQLTAAKEAGATFQKSIEDQVQAFLKEGLSAEGLDKPGFLAQNIKENRKSKLDLDFANANFNAEISAANNLTDRAFVQSLEIDEDFDHGSGSYLEYASVVKALQGNFKEGGSMDFGYEGKNKFKFGVTINNPRWREGDPEDEKTITYSAQEIQSLIGENDPAARAQIEENITTSLTTLKNTAEADLDKRFASGMASGKDGSMYSGEKSVEGTVQNFMTEMRQQDENNPDDPSLIDDIFNNKVKFNDKIRLEELQRANGGGALAALAKDGESSDKLAMLLDLPHNEISYSKKLLKEMGITDPDQVKNALNTLEEAKNNMVERYLKNEVMGMGITSKYIQPKEPKSKSTGGGKTPKVDQYAPEQAEATYETGNEVMGAIDAANEVLGVMQGQGGEASIRQTLEQDPNVQFNFTALSDSLEGRVFNIDGAKVTAKSFDITRDGTIKFDFDKDSATVDVIGTEEMYEAGEITEDQIGVTVAKAKQDFQKDSATYNIYNPEDMRNFYKAMSPEAGGSGEYARQFSTIDYDENATANFITDQNFLSKAGDEKFDQWIKWIDTRNKRVRDASGNLVIDNFGKRQLINRFVQEPAFDKLIDPASPIYNKQIHEYYKKNKRAFDDKLIDAQGFGN